MVLKEALARAIDTDIGALHASAGTSVAGGAADDADMLAVVLALETLLMFLKPNEQVLFTQRL